MAREARSWGGSGLLAVLGLGSLAAYAGIAAAGDLRARLDVYLLGHGLLFALYLAAVRLLISDRKESTAPARSDRPAVRSRPGGAGMVLAFGLLFRAVLLPTEPTLSDDVHRYVWDGRVQAAGTNPYAYPPDAAELRSLRDADWERVNHKEIRTIYPPASQAVFLAGAAAGLGTVGFKAIFCAFDLLCAVLLAAILRRLGRNPSLALVYAWNPLVVVEVASSGHLDPVGLFFLLGSVALIIREHRALSIVSYAISCLTRGLPFALAVVFLRRFKLRHLLLAGAVGLVAVGPYLGAGADLLSGLSAYAEHWDYNSVVFPVLRSALEPVVPVEPLKRLITVVKELLGDPGWAQGLYRLVWPGPLARVILGAAMGAGSLWISLREPRVERELLLAIGLLLVLSPTVHPWYALWILPFAAMTLSFPWIILSGLLPLSYLSSRAVDGRVPDWVLLLEWGIPAVLFAAVRLRPRIAERLGPR